MFSRLFEKFARKNSILIPRYYFNISKYVDHLAFRIYHTVINRYFHHFKFPVLGRANIFFIDQLLVFCKVYYLDGKISSNHKFRLAILWHGCIQA